MKEGKANSGFKQGWLKRQLKEVVCDVAAWPAWMRRVAGIEPYEGETEESMKRRRF